MRQRRIDPAGRGRRNTGFAYLDDPDGVLAFAHRGGATHPDLRGLENTLAAFRHATEMGYRYLETDVHATTDGVLLAFHDEVLDRVTDGTGALGALTSGDVARVRVAGREPVPRLADLFDAFPGARFNLDLKSDAAVAPLVELIEQRADWDRVLVGSFARTRLLRFRRLTQGRVPTSAHPAEVAAYLAAPGAVRRRRGRTPGPAALQIPHRRGRLTIASPALIRRAHVDGLHVHVWTIDDPQEMHVLLDRGVDGLFTDRTDLLKQVLIERGQWE